MTGVLASKLSSRRSLPFVHGAEMNGAWHRRKLHSTINRWCAGYRWCIVEQEGVRNPWSEVGAKARTMKWFSSSLAGERERWGSARSSRSWHLRTRGKISLCRLRSSVQRDGVLAAVNKIRTVRNSFAHWPTRSVSAREILHRVPVTILLLLSLRNYSDARKNAYKWA